MQSAVKSYTYRPTNTKALSWNEIQRFSYRQGLPKPLVRRFLNIVHHDLSHCGPEWTVGKLKEVKDGFKAYFASGFDKAKLHSYKVKKTRTGNLAGVFGQLQRLCHSEVEFVKVMNLLQISSAFMAKEPTAKQIKKFVDAVQTDRNPNTPKEYKDLLVMATSLLPKVPFGECVDVITSPSLKESHDSRLLSEWMAWSRSPEGLKTITSDWFQPFVSGPANLINLMGFRGMYSRETVPVGNIYVTQEPGYKLRCFAAPMIWTQICLEPFKKFLMTHLQLAPWDMTHNQRLHDTTISKALASGQEVYCYDLSNASDLIPWDSQEAMLRAIVPQEKHHFIELFKLIAKGEWNFTPTGERISWHRGQPLGSGPSFGSFALWHGLLLLALNGGEHNDKFFIVGDDVIILDDQLAGFYEQALDDIKLDWSPLKTLHSHRLAEFTGKLITAKRIYNCPKWKKFTEDNFVDNLFIRGHRFFDFVPKKHRPVIKAVAALPEPWGIGYNPEGLSLDERLNNCHHLLISDKEIIPHDLSPRDRVSFRLQALSDWESSCFWPVAASRSFQQNTQKHQESAVEAGIRSLSKEKRNHILANALNLTSLLWLDEKDATPDSPVHCNLPRTRARIKKSKRAKNRQFDKLNALARRFKDIVPATEA